MPKLNFHRSILPLEARTCAPGATAYFRGAVERNYALLPPEGVLDSRMPDYAGTIVRFLASPKMGAGFVQTMLLVAPGGGTSRPRNDGLQHFLLVQEGTFNLGIEGFCEGHELTEGGYAYVPPGVPFTLKNEGDRTARVLEFYRPYVPAEGLATPGPVVSNIAQVEKVNHTGNPGRGWQHLLPDDLAFDMEMNVLSFAPGTHFPSVETHIMEHSLFLLKGQGMYLLDRDWHEVWAEDYIWMGPWVPQQFYATGWDESAYLLYKDVNRDVSFG
ncbi:(S)-ureidoglycine aminohydrolase [Rhodobacter sp. JA431]|uniref:(S)-ureidoglycine aminohydrolase n=1 Tax=Rhodobacter sp. JA431 TaxID=570013 RepID=UPI000BDBC01F|nr:(S)-ureidoglycine aminohydrolase [Rhodobacter sp. JA431]SOC10431.1 (S)-ureidoglycine aminohydrolase [Rhodobacter sp. JA431]